MSHRKLAVHYLLRTGLLAFFAFYILRLVKTDQLIIYIGPRMQLYVKLAAMGFYVMAILQLYLAFLAWWGNRPAAADCNCGSCSPDDSSRAGTVFFYSLFAIPVLLFMLLPDQALNSRLIDKKGISLTGTISESTAVVNASQQKKESSISSTPTPAAQDDKLDSSTSADSLDALFPYDEYSEDLARLAKKLYKQDAISIQDQGFLEVVSSIAFYMNNFIGKQVDITGFVYREENMKNDQFVIARFAVQCCSADSSPFGFMVETPLGQELKQDTWVKITGKLSTTNYNGNEILKIDASKIQHVDAPSTPYVSPDPDYFQAAAP